MEYSFNKIILHCGIHKTGSSYLQSIFDANSDVIARHGVVYPKFKNLNSPHRGNHSIIAVNYRGESDVFGYLRKFLIVESAQPTLLISGEEFSRPHILKPFLTHLVMQAKPAQVQVIYYLRRFDHLLESVYSESVKRTLVGGVERAAYALDFADIVEPAVERVGVANVIVRPYNKALWKGGMLGADFFDAIGIGGAFGEIVEGANEELNASFSRTQTFILSCLSAKEEKQNMAAFFLNKKLPVKDTSRYFMTPQRRDNLNKSHLVRCQEYFSTLGIADFAAFLGIEGTLVEPNWTPFVPDKAVIGEYMQEFIKDGNAVDMAAFMGEIDKRA